LKLHTLHLTLYIPSSTLCTPHYILHFTLCTLHLTLHTLHFTLRTLHFTLHTLHFTLHTLHLTLRTLHSTFYTPHSTLYSPHFPLGTWHSTLHTLHFALHTPHSTLSTSKCRCVDTLHSTLYTSHSTFYTPHSTLYTPHFTLYTPHYILHYTLHSTLYTSHVASSSHNHNLPKIQNGLQPRVATSMRFSSLCFLTFVPWTYVWEFGFAGCIFGRVWLLVQFCIRDDEQRIFTGAWNHQPDNMTRTTFMFQHHGTRNCFVEFETPRVATPGPLATLFSARGQMRQTPTLQKHLRERS